MRTVAILMEAEKRQADRMVERLARACWSAQWEDTWPREGTIEHALALQIGAAAFEEMKSMVAEYGRSSAIG